MDYRNVIGLQETTIGRNLFIAVHIIFRKRTFV